MTDYLIKIKELSDKISDIADLCIEFPSQSSDLASLKDIVKLADELKQLANDAIAPPF